MDVRESRLNSLESQILWFEENCKAGHKLSTQQREQLQELSYTVSVFGEYGWFLHEIAEEILAA